LIPAANELVRLAFPRRMYTQSHLDYVGEVVSELYCNRAQITGLTITEETPYLRHFTAKFTPDTTKILQDDLQDIAL
ncbi:MAG: hypothetical protein V4577_10795, partial [Bacteroidota bacterium]